MPDATMIFMSPLLPRPVAVLAIWAPPAIVRLPAATDTDPPAPEPRLPAFIVLTLDDPAESSTMSSIAVTLMVPPFPQPASALHEMAEPASKLMFCPVTATEPAAPGPWVPALIVLTREDPVESSTILP